METETPELLGPLGCSLVRILLGTEGDLEQHTKELSLSHRAELFRSSLYASVYNRNQEDQVTALIEKAKVSNDSVLGEVQALCTKLAEDSPWRSTLTFARAWFAMDDAGCQSSRDTY